MTDTITPESLRALGQACSEFDWHGSVPKSAEVVNGLGIALIAAAEEMDRLKQQIADNEDFYHASMQGERYD